MNHPTIFKQCKSKICSQINPQPIENFGRDKAISDGLSRHCRMCNALRTKKYYALYPEKKKIADKKYSLAHKEQKKLLDKEYAKNNRYKIRARNKIWYAKRRKIDINFVLSRNLRSRLRSALLGNSKHGSAVRDLGCSIEEFRKYIEAKFLGGMSWENYGKWELDHIFPLSKVNLANREELLKVCHYTNYQPLWKRDNIIKFNHIPIV